MRKKLLFLAMALFCLSGATMAQDKDYGDNITYSDGEIQVGKYGVVTVYATIGSNHYNGAEIHWTGESMPAGLTVTQVLPTEELLETYPLATFEFNLNKIENTYKIMLYNTKDAQNQYVPIGTEVPIFEIYFEVDESFSVGDEIILDVDHGEYSLFGKSIHTAGTKYGLTNKQIKLKVVDPKPRVIDENSTKDIKDSYKGDAEDLIVKRTMKAGTWSTLYLPFGLSRAEKNEVFPGATIATLNPDEYEYDAETNTINILFNSVRANSSLSANTFYVVQPQSDIAEFEVSNKVVEKAESSTESVYYDEATDADIVLKSVGTFKVQKIPANGVFLSGNKFYISKGNSNIKALRGYLMLDEFFTGAAEANVNFIIDGEATAIEGLKANGADGNVYSISGVYMGKASDMNKLPRGIYIVNNKKVTVK